MHTPIYPVMNHQSYAQDSDLEEALAGVPAGVAQRLNTLQMLSLTGAAEEGALFDELRQDEDLRRLYQFRFKGWGLLQFEVEQLDGLIMDRVELRELLYPRT